MKKFALMLMLGVAMEETRTFRPHSSVGVASQRRAW